jgi:hypothetical protein
MRKMKWSLLVIAAVLAIVANADTVQVALRLSADSNLRTAVAAYAATVAPAATVTPQGMQPDQQIKEVQKKLAEELKQGEIASGFGSLPVGWEQCINDNDQLEAAACYRATQGWLHIAGVAWGTKVAGLLLTALAASLGAPFWFGLLQTVNAVRSTGPKPASSAAKS